MTQPTEQQGNQPESSEQPVYQPAPAWAPQFSAAAPAIPNGSSTTSGIATANGHATVCAIAYVGPGTSGLSGAAALIVGVRLPQVRPMLRSWPALWLALGGIILIVAAARYEASLKSMRTIAARIGDLR